MVFVKVMLEGLIADQDYVNTLHHLKLIKIVENLNKDARLMGKDVFKHWDCVQVILE
jgi:hypothetical protein